MKVLLAIAACLLASAAWAQQKVTPVVVTNPALTVQAADAGRYTHVGQRASRIVNLRTQADGFAYRVDPATGLIEQTQQFQVPEGFALVLTDVASRFSSCTAGSIWSFVIFQWINGSNPIRAAITSTCSSAGDFFVERHYATGIVFGAGSEIRTNALGTVEIEGYLVPAG